jgi:hypothetical protein
MAHFVFPITDYHYPGEKIKQVQAAVRMVLPDETTPVLRFDTFLMAIATRLLIDVFWSSAFHILSLLVGSRVSLFTTRTFLFTRDISVGVRIPAKLVDLGLPLAKGFDCDHSYSTGISINIDEDANTGIIKHL